MEEINFIKYSVDGEYIEDTERKNYCKTGIIAAKNLGEAANIIENFYGNELLRINRLEYMFCGNIVEFKDKYKFQTDDLFVED